MTNTCTKWQKKDQLLEGALAETIGSELRDHLAQCANCAAELKALQARRERMEALLPQLATGAEPSPDLHARILGTLEASATRRRSGFRPSWALAGAMAVIAIVVMVGLAWNRRIARQEAELRGAQALAQWRAPTDVLLQTPGHEFLTGTPRLGESYIRVPVESDKGGNK